MWKLQETTSPFGANIVLCKPFLSSQQDVSLLVGMTTNTRSVVLAYSESPGGKVMSTRASVQREITKNMFVLLAGQVR